MFSHIQQFTHNLTVPLLPMDTIARIKERAREMMWDDCWDKITLSEWDWELEMTIEVVCKHQGGRMCEFKVRRRRDRNGRI